MAYNENLDATVAPHDSNEPDEASRLELEIAEGEATAKNDYKSSFLRFALAGGTIAAMGLGSSLFGYQLFKADDPLGKFLRNGVFGSAGIIYGTFTFLYGIVLAKSRFASKEADLAVLRTRLRILRRFSVDEANEGYGSYFDSLVRINVENLAAYYTLVKAQTDKSFLVSLGVGVIGFVLIVTGLMFGVVETKRSEILSYMSTGSGIITEFIAGVFFYLYNKAVGQMKGYHDSLLVVQNILLSFKLVGDTKDEGEKTKMMGQMLGYLVGSRVGISSGKQDESDPKRTSTIP
jgi:hypothetical protein